jgi:hypothetical protein
MVLQSWILAAWSWIGRAWRTFFAEPPVTRGPPGEFQDALHLLFGEPRLQDHPCLLKGQSAGPSSTEVITAAAIVAPSSVSPCAIAESTPNKRA